MVILNIEGNFADDFHPALVFGSYVDYTCCKAPNVSKYTKTSVK